MAGPAGSAKPASATSAAASASNGAAPLAAPVAAGAPTGYAMPPPSALHVIPPIVAPPPAPSTAPSVRVIVPARGTLAAGKYEAKPATIWIVVAAGALLLLAWAFFRVRRVTNERRRRLEAMTRAPGAGAAAGRRAASALTPRA